MGQQVTKKTQFIDWLGEQRPFYGHRITSVSGSTPTPTPPVPTLVPMFNLMPNQTSPFKSLYSYNGLTWFTGGTTDNTFSNVSGGQKIISNGQIWVAGIGNNTSNILYWSEDGITYSASTNASTFGMAEVTDLTWDGTRFLASCRSAPDGLFKLLSSTDGKTWSLVTDFGTTRLRATAWNGSRYVLTFSGSTAIQYSDDLIIYSATTLPNGGSNVEIRDIIWGGTKFVVGGSGQSTGSGVWSSSDGITWTQASTTGLTAGTLMWDGSKYYLGDTIGIWSSTDALTWTRRTTASAFYGLVFNGTTYLAIGSGPLIRYSVDGITWVSASLPGSVGALGSYPSPYNYAPVN